MGSVLFTAFMIGFGMMFGTNVVRKEKKQRKYNKNKKKQAKKGGKR